MAAPVPATLPRPDGKPADMTKKVKVYILAGQSNMVGFGPLTGAGPVNDEPPNLWDQSHQCLQPVEFPPRR